MRESTISFFKEVFVGDATSKRQRETQPSTYGDDDIDGIFDKDLDPVMGNSMSLLKSRRMSAKKITIRKMSGKGTASATREGTRATDKMSCDI